VPQWYWRGHSKALTDSLRCQVSQLGFEVVEVQPSAYPTNLFASVQTPADTEVTKSCARLAKSPTPSSKLGVAEHMASDDNLNNHCLPSP